MKKEDKELLLKDLCGRLPYGVKAQMPFMYDKVILTCRDISAYSFNTDSKIVHIPYLRPMSSMTEEEKKEFDDFCVIDEEVWMKKGITGFINQSIIMSNGIDWLNAHHFDYRGLIPKGLALEAPKDMYKFK